MGASSSAASKNPSWYPGEPSEEVLSQHGYGYYGEDVGSLQPPSPSKKGGDGGGGELPVTAQGAKPTKKAVVAAAAVTTPASPLPPPTTATTPPPVVLNTEPGARGVVGTGDGTNPAGPLRTNVRAINSKAKSRRKGRHDITSLPVVELSDMKFIAHGAFCAVFKCQYKGHSVVAKRVREDLPLAARREALNCLWEEFECLRPLSHPNVIEAYGMCRVRCREGYEDWNEKDVCLLLEELAFGTVGHLFGTIYNVEKNLASAMAKSRLMKMIPFRCRLDRVLELALALEYVHGGSGIGVMLHRDIKSVNVGFAQNGRLKLMDFGLSKMVPPGTTEDETYKMTGEVGSYRYMAPELVKHRPYNEKVDIYSWAVLSWEMLAIEKPYAWATQTSFVTRVINGGERPELHKSWPDRLRKLLASAWHTDHTKRPTAAQLVAELSAVKAELPAKYRRQRPSLTAPAPDGGVGEGGDSSKGRRKSWTPQRSKSAPKSRPAGDHGDDARGGGEARTKPRLKPSVSLPLPAASPSPARRGSSSEKSSRKRYRLAGRSLSPGKFLASSADGGAGGGGGGGGVKGIRGSFTSAGRRRRRSRSRSGAAAAADRIVEKEGNDKHRDGRRGREGGEGEGEAGGAKTDDDSGTGHPLHRRRNSRQREIIMDALAREAGAETGARPLLDRRTPTRLAQREAGHAGEGRYSSRQQSGGGGNEERAASASVPAPAPAPAPAESESDLDAAGAAAANKERLRQARRSSTVGRKPAPDPPHGDCPETSALARHIPETHVAATPASRKAFADKPVSVDEGNSNGDQRSDGGDKPVDWGVTAAATVKGRDRNGSVSRSTPEKYKGASTRLQLPLPSVGKTNLVHTVDAAAIEEKAGEEDEGDISGRTSRGVSRNSSLSKIWHPASPPRADGRNASGVFEAPPQLEGRDPPAQRGAAAGATSGRELGILSALGNPNGLINREDIEARLGRLRGTLSMPRTVSDG